MQETFSFVSLKQFTGHFTPFDFPRLQLIRDPISLFLNHSNGLQTSGSLIDQHLMILQVLFAFDSNIDCKVSISSSSNLFGWMFLAFCQNHLFCSVEISTHMLKSMDVIITINFQFVDFQQHFSLNRSKKTKLPTNFVLLAQNSTYSMLKKTMLFIFRKNDTY